MPTKEELDELVNRCKWEWTAMNGKNGYKVTGPNGKSVFLSAAGGRFHASIGGTGEIGSYWSATVAYGGANAGSLYFDDGHHGPDWDRKYRARPVRAVSE